MIPPDARVFGLKPWFPWPLSRWHWLTEPLPAERLAALRIGVALVMFLDVVSSFYACRNDLFGPDSLGDPRDFRQRFEPQVGFKVNLPGREIDLESSRWSLLHDSDFAEGR